MRRACLLALALSVTLVVGACSADEPTGASALATPAETKSSDGRPSDAEPSRDETAVSVVKALSAALNAGDNEAAAALSLPTRA